MDGDGPLNGTPKQLKTVLFADDPVSADSTLIQLLGQNVDSVTHVREAGHFIGNLNRARILQLE